MQKSKPWNFNLFWLSLVDLALIAGTLAIFQFSDIDLELQNKLFIPQKNSWIIDSKEPIGRLFFYNLPKILFGLLLTAVFLLLIFNQKLSREKISTPPKILKNSSSQASHPFFYFLPSPLLEKLPKKIVLFQVFIGLALIPLIAGNIKKFTNIYCPNQLEIYGSDKPYIRIFDHYPKDFEQKKRGQCFPAGHAVTGFALYIFCFVQQNRRKAVIWFGLASLLGWILGFYQMAKGAHFLSDTLVSMLVCHFLAILIAAIFRQITKSNQCQLD